MSQLNNYYQRFAYSKNTQNVLNYIFLQVSDKEI